MLVSARRSSTLEDMLDSMKGQDGLLPELAPSLPIRPTSKARLPSSVRMQNPAPSTLPVLHHLSPSPSPPQSIPTSIATDFIYAESREVGNVDLPFARPSMHDTNAYALIATSCSASLEEIDRIERMESSDSLQSWVDGTVSRDEMDASVDLSAEENGRMLMEADADSDSVKGEDRNGSASSSDSEHSIEERQETKQQATLDGDVHPTASTKPAVFERAVSKRWRDESVPSLKKNSRVWCPGSDNKWTLGIVEASNNTESIISTTTKQDGPKAGRFPKLLKVVSSKLLPANPYILEGVDDLIQLSYLNEPAVLHNLEYRYAQDKIYTRAGPVLIAVNPFKKVSIYNAEFVEAYRTKSKDATGPHVYTIADSAFRAMMTDGVNQSVIISGESGAGKTETAKIAMQYLAALGGGGGVQNEILQTNPILEAFGNAKTLRNDNSSRFGKLIDIFFHDSGKICGAKIQTYLLEKSRVVQQSKGERSYHVFYQLCSGADKTLRETLNLRSADFYQYLNQSGCLVIDNVDDAARFCSMLAAMNDVQISKEDQENAFSLLAAVLWLGNITFSFIDNENHVCVDDNEAVTSAAKLLQCSKEKLMETLTTRKIRAGHENIVQKLTHTQALDSRDALAKAIYANLFDWLVDCINKSLEVGKQHTDKSICILDIYGFESFEKNSFEQLCINYANERLQQHFNRHLFKLEQEEYNSEGIDWTQIEFEDNQECLELIEKRPLGLISLLDEECTFPKGTDLTLANKLQEHLAGNPCFKGERGRAFCILHFAGEVVYNTVGFLEKNRDLLHSDLLQLLSSCEFSLPQQFASRISQVPQTVTRAAHRTAMGFQKQSVVTKFKGQLFQLMQRLEGTTPHFIRCIKPNALQQPGVYDHQLVLQQLRCCGVLEVVRISRSGYPTRLTHQDFATRYGFLLRRELAEEDVLSVCVVILQNFNVPPDMYQVGYTKLFFRAGQVGRMEEMRMQALQGVIGMQKLFRGYRVRKQYLELRKATLSLQSITRGKRARRVYIELRQRHQAAVVIQKFVRRKNVYKVYLRLRAMAILLQSAARSQLARKHLEMLRQGIEIPQVKAKGRTKKDQEAWVAESIKVAGASSSPSSSVSELQKRLLAAEAALRDKIEDNAQLQQKVEQYESRWSDYEAKMSSMEDMWHLQISSLQKSLAKAKKNLATEEQQPDNNMRQGGPRLPPDDDGFEWDDTTSVGTKTPDQSLTPWKPPIPLPYSPSVHHLALKGDLDAGRSVVANLVKEFEQRTQVYEDDARFLVEVKEGLIEAHHLNPDEELRKLRYRFQIWKKDFKVRLREVKGVLHKLGNMDSAERLRKKWWGKKAN